MVRQVSTQRSEGLELRERILLASVQLVEQQGLDGLSLREVARRAGVSHQAPYHYFKDRSAILGAIAQRGFVMLRQALEVVERSRKPAPARLKAAVLAYVQFATRNPAYFRIMFRPEVVDLKQCPSAQEEGDKTFECVQRIVHASVAEGLLIAPAEEALVAFVWSVAHGLASLRLDGALAAKSGSAERIPDVASVLESLFASVMAAKPKRTATLARAGKP